MADVFVKPTASGANDGTSWTDAWGTLQEAVDNATIGDEIFCQGTETISADIDLDIMTPIVSAPVWIYGVNTDESVTPKDDVDGTLYTIDGNSTATSCILGGSGKGYYRFVNIECINATANGWSLVTSHYWILWGCRGSNCANGIRGAGGPIGVNIIQCQFNNNSVSGTINIPGPNTLILMCETIGNGVHGVDPSNDYATLLFCVIHNNSVNGIHLGRPNALFNVIDGNGGVGYAVSTFGSAYFNRITNNGTYGLTLSNNLAGNGFNAYYNNTSGENDNATTYASTNLPRTDISMSGDGYNDKANDDFTLTDVAEFRRRALLIGSYSV